MALIDIILEKIQILNNESDSFQYFTYRHSVRKPFSEMNGREFLVVGVRIKFSNLAGPNNIIWQRIGLISFFHQKIILFVICQIGVCLLPNEGTCQINSLPSVQYGLMNTCQAH